MVSDSVLAILAIVGAYLAWQQSEDTDPVTEALANPTDEDSDSVPDGVESDTSSGGTETAVNAPTFERLSGGVA